MIGQKIHLFVNGCSRYIYTCTIFTIAHSAKCLPIYICIIWMRKGEELRNNPLFQCTGLLGSQFMGPEPTQIWLVTSGRFPADEEWGGISQPHTHVATEWPFQRSSHVISPRVRSARLVHTSDPRSINAVKVKPIWFTLCGVVPLCVTPPLPVPQSQTTTAQFPSSGYRLRTIKSLHNSE
jgi:hypothetical protein